MQRKKIGKTLGSSLWSPTFLNGCHGYRKVRQIGKNVDIPSTYLHHHPLLVKAVPKISVTTTCYRNNIVLEEDEVGRFFEMLSYLAEEPSKNAFDDFFDNELLEVREQYGSDSSLKVIEQYLNNSPKRHIDRTYAANINLETSQPWRDGLWCLTDDPADSIEKTRGALPSQTFVSPTDVLNSSYDLSRHPDKSWQRSAIGASNAAITNPDRRQAHDLYVTSVEEASPFSPAPLNSQSLYRGYETSQDGWEHDLQTFSLQADDPFTPSRGRALHPQVHNWKQASNPARSITIPSVPQTPTRYHYPFQHVTSHGSGNTLSGSPFRGVTHANPMTVPDYGKDWTMEGPSSLDSSHNSHESCLSRNQHTNPSNRYVHRIPHQWRSHRDAEDGDHEIVVPVPRHKPIDIVNQFASLPLENLATSYPLPEEIGRAISYVPNTMQDYEMARNAPSPAHEPLFTSYPSLPFRPSKTELNHHNRNSFRPSNVQSSPSQSPSPTIPISPAQRSSKRISQQQSPSRPDRTRRKSIHKTGPIKETATSPVEAALCSPTRNRSRTRSHSRSRSSHARTRSASSKFTRAVKHSSAPPNATFDFDFVNYTVRDSEKLMSDVAPSGSSKTRARREQEAKDKTKKLSEAAIIAVRNAGGDVRDLQKRLAL